MRAPARLYLTVDGTVTDLEHEAAFLLAAQGRPIPKQHEAAAVKFLAEGSAAKGPDLAEKPKPRSKK